MVGLALSPTREVVPMPPPTSPPGSSTTASLEPTSNPTPAGVFPASPLPVGVYHLTQAQANAVAQVARFYSAYNAGQLSAITSRLSDRPRLVDCDYTTRKTVTLVGRTTVLDYLRARFAQRDRWTVEFDKENSENPNTVVVLPVERVSDELRSLGASGGVKRDFAGLDFYLVLESGDLRVSEIQWGTDGVGIGAEARLCQPMAQP